MRIKLKQPNKWEIPSVLFPNGVPVGDMISRDNPKTESIQYGFPVDLNYIDDGQYDHLCAIYKKYSGIEYEHTGNFEFVIGEDNVQLIQIHYSQNWITFEDYKAMHIAMLEIYGNEDIFKLELRHHEILNLALALRLVMRHPNITETETICLQYRNLENYLRKFLEEKYKGAKIIFEVDEQSDLDAVLPY